MKFKIIFICLTFLSTITFSQTKVGTVDSDYIVNLMPEAKIVVKMSQAYGAKLDSSFSIKLKEFQDKVEVFKKNEATLGELAKKTTINELSGLETAIKKYKQNGNQLMQLKRDELMRPLYKKLSNAIQQVAKENSYTQILTINGNEFAYIDEKFDITKLVLTNLGITEDVK